jgi:hypothetical protein
MPGPKSSLSESAGQDWWCSWSCSYLLRAEEGSAQGEASAEESGAEESGAEESAAAESGALAEESAAA